MRNTDDFKERFERWKNGENYWAIRADRDQYLSQYSGGKPKKQYVYDVLPGLFAKDGVNIRVSSGYRNTTVEGTGRPSRHATNQAADIVGDFAQIRKVLDNPNSNVSKWMVANGYGYIDETAKTGTTKYWSPRRRREYEQGISDNSHYHIGADSYYSKQYAAQINKLLAQAAQTQPSVTYAMQPIVQPEPPAIPVTTKPVDTNKIHAPAESPNVNIAGDIIAAIQKMDKEKRNRTLDETAGFGSLPNPIAFFNSFWGEDLPTRQSLNKPIV